MSCSVGCSSVVHRPYTQPTDFLPEVIGDLHHTLKFRLFEYLLFLKFRDRLDPTLFRSGKGDRIASMQRV
jgi:hypothetical protein